MYNFQTPGAHKGRLAIYAVVLLVFVVSATVLVSNNNQSETKDQTSGYVIAKTEEYPKPLQIDNVQKQLDKLKSDIGYFSSNLTSCYDGTASLSRDVQTCKADAALCKADFAKLSANKTVTEQACLSEKSSLQLIVSTAETRSSDLNKTLTQISSEYSTLKNQYTSLASNSANNICCKSKVDNPKLKFYKIESDKITCAEDSGTALNC